MKCLILLACVFAFMLPVQAQETEVTNDPESRLHFTEEDLPSREKDPAGPSEIEQFARGDTKALKQFFSIAHDADGAAAESIAGFPRWCITFSVTRSSRSSF